jgi:hypothetical protein
MSVTLEPVSALVSTIAWLLIFNAFVNGAQPPTNANDKGDSLRFASSGTKFPYGLR